MSKRFEEIDLYGNREVQLNLFTSIENSKSLDGKSFWPKYAEGNKYLREILENPSEFTGIDFEFDPKTNKPTITGLANHNLAASAPYSKEVVDFIVQVAELGMTRLVGYSVIGAEKEVIEKVLGREISLDCFEDGMITHFLLNQDLVKQSSGGKVGGEKGSLGFLNLWTMNTFYCGLPQFKMCRGVTCTGPCPSHKVFGYNAMDSYVAREGFIEMLKEMEEKGVPYQFYRDLLKVSYIAHLMQKGGVRVDRDLIARLDKISDDEKEKLFPYTQSGKTKKYEHFNPNAPAAAVNYFKKHKIFLDKFNAEAIEKALTELADNNDVGLTEFVQGIDSHPLPYQLLIKAYQYKGAGKGFKSWFDDKFFGDDGLMHPRFIVIGTSTGRFSSKDPNFQNIPGYDEDTPQEEQSPFAQARVAIIPKRDDQCLIKADKSNLEFRMCVDPYTKILKEDLTWIYAKDLFVDDKLIGFDENQDQGNRGTRFKESSITDLQFLRKKTFTIETNRGSLTAADDHLVVVLRKSKKGYLSRVWVEMKDIVTGDILPFTAEPWTTKTQFNDGYIAGIFDGEGSVSSGGVQFGQADGPIFDKVEKLLYKDCFNFSISIKKKQPQYRKTHKTIQLTGIWNSLRFLGEKRPERLLQKSKKIWNGKRTWGKNGEGRATVLNVIEYDNPQPLVCITTTSKTYISNGFYSHNCMWYAGFDTYKIEKDAFQWIVNVSDGAFKDAAKMLGKTERAVAKSVAHGSNYGEGIILLREEDLAKPKIKAAIKMGAIVPYYDWEYAGGIIAFSGVNLAQRIFKDTSLEARAKANDLLEGKYFGKFKIIREWQQRVLQEIEKTGILKAATGRFIRLQDEPLECAKQAFSFLGQGTSADHVQGDMINFFDRYGMDGVPLLQVHDELVFEKPKVWTDEQCIEFLSVMEQEDKRIKGFWCPVKMYRGANWAQIKRIK